MAEIVMRFDVQDVDPTRVDPHDISDWLIGLYDIERRAHNAPFELAFEHLECEWEDS